MPNIDQEILRGQDLLKSLDCLSTYDPIFRSGWKQTIAGQYWPQEHPRVRPLFHEVEIERGDRLIVAEYSPSRIHGNQKTAFLVHGLNGSYRSRYIQRLAARLLTMNFRVLCVNLRNCGPGLGLCSRPYNAGVSEDIHLVMDWMFLKFSSEMYFACGFSLGGNILLKALGEKNHSNRRLFAAAISTPVDLVRSTEKLSRTENKFFDRFFCHQTAKDYRRSKRLSKEKPFSFSWKKGLVDFDEEITAGWAGFASAQEYHERSSALNVLEKISVPTLILAAEDDPVVDTAPLLSFPEHEKVQIVLTKHGGHVGFLNRNKAQRRWADEVISEWFEMMSGS